MKPVVTLLILFSLLTGSLANGELILLKSGKTVEGRVTFENQDSLSVRLPSGEIQIQRDTIERVMTDAEAVEWKKEQERLQAQPASPEGLLLQVIDQDRPIVRDSSLKEISKEDPRRVLASLVEFPGLAGNAAHHYWLVLDVERFRMRSILTTTGAGVENWNFEDPIFEKMIEATRLRDCFFYPDPFPYPAGIWQQSVPFNRLVTISQGLSALGRQKIARGEVEAGIRSMEAALIIGFHVVQDAPVYFQYSTGCQIQIESAGKLADYYLNAGNRDKYRLFFDYASRKERELAQLRHARQDLLQKLRAGRIKELMEYAQSGENILLRGEAMNLLTLIKLIGEQQPLRRDIENIIPIAYSTTIKTVGQQDSEQIAELFRNLEQKDPNGYIRSHATRLQELNAPNLPRVIRTVLAQS